LTNRALRLECSLAGNELTAGDVPHLQAVRALYEREAGLRVPGTIHSFVDGQMLTVKV
jgi:hypothetical protein